MPSIPRENREQSVDPVAESQFQELAQKASMHMAYPVLITGVNRKVNVGNYENIDLFCGLSLPVMALPENLEEFRRMVTEASELGFAITSQETGMRYTQIKDLQNEGRSNPTK